MNSETEITELQEKNKKLKNRIRHLAEDKANLSLIHHLIEGLILENDDIDSMLNNLMIGLGECIGGTDIELYHWEEDGLHYTNLFGQNTVLKEIKDPLVEEVFAHKNFVEQTTSIEGAGLHSTKSTMAWDWVIPLIINKKAIGAIKISNMLGSAPMRTYLVPIFHHLALILNNQLATKAAEVANDSLKKIAYFDQLTGLPNRTLLSDRLSQALAQTQRNKKNMAICFLDLDGFKEVNDTFGHAIGDKLLISVTERISSSLRKIDTLSRIGGDEFVLLLLELNHTDEFINSIKRVLEILQKPFSIEDNVINISVSIGVTLFPENDNDADTLLRHADQAMYTAKQKGKNQYYLFDTKLNQQYYQHEQEVNRIKKALSDN